MKCNPLIGIRRASGPAFPGWRKVCATAGVLFIVTLGAAGQPSATNSAGSASELVAQLQARLAQARAELGAVSAASAGPTNLPPGASTTEAHAYHLIAESLVLTYQNHIEQAGRLEEARLQQRAIEQRTKVWAGFSEPGPYSILLIDELRDSVQSLTAKIAASETSLKVLAALTEDAEFELKKSDEHLRLLAEQLETSTDVSRNTELTWHRTLEDLRNRQAAASVALNETRRRRVEIELAEHRQRLALVRRQLVFTAQNPRFSQADLDQVLASSDAEQREVEREMPEAEREFESQQRDLTAAREELRNALQTSAGTEAIQNGQDPHVRQLQALVELRAARVETSAQRLVVLRLLAEKTLTEHSLWQMRFAAFQEQDLARLREGYQRLERLWRLLRSVKPHFVQQVELAASLIAEQRNRVQNRSGAQAEGADAQELLNLYRLREELAHRALRSVEKMERLALRWKESLDEGRQHLPATARVRDLFGGVSSFASKLWHFELFAAEDTITVDGQKITGRRSVTVGKVAMAFLILGVGYRLSIILSGMLERIAVKRLKVEINQANLIRRWIRVALVFTLVVFSLVSVKIPLTVFAFLGGALAIGVGFGTQNLLKNFISGIIILFERPFRVGDVLDIGGHRGTVISVGIRSSVLKLFDGTETLIPNSALLENNVSNCTYSDRNVRFSVTVGVAYGSDTRRVAQLLAEAAGRHGLVQKEPVPQIIFQEFGESALSFELRYWVDVLNHNAAQIGSDLRHMIAGTFEESGIVMAFPQRDIHMDSSHPLRVQILPAEKTQKG